MRRCKPIWIVAYFGIAALLGGCAGGSEPVRVARSAEELAPACSSFEGRGIERQQIGLPSGEAKVESAQLVPSVAANAGTNGGAQSTMPAYCRLLGGIAPLDARAPVIKFQVNLPLNWNRKTLQYGGGGFNGVLITGLAPLRDAPNAAPTPIAQGYVTFGTDSGHQANAYPPTEVAAWALNEEARINFAYASYKKVKDVAHALVADFYGYKPAKSYFFGGSEGGREGLTMAQRFPGDYDGIVSVVPVINYIGLNHSFLRAQLLQMIDRGEGWLPPRKLKTLAEAVSKACDALDGLEDGVIGNYLACSTKFDPAALRCPSGRDFDDACLSDRQVEIVRAIYSKYRLIEPMVNGITEYPARLPGGRTCRVLAGTCG
jgi:Tannase and feruloyl esterase